MSGKTAAIAPPITLIIIDPSVVSRRVLKRRLADNPALTVKGVVASVGQAMPLLASGDVDCLLVDIDQPGHEPAAVLATLRAACPTARIVVTSARCTEGGPHAIEALANGASDIVSKPANGDLGGSFCERLIARLTTLRDGRAQNESSQDCVEPQMRPIGKDLRAIGIGASTGGLAALAALFKQWRRSADVPVFVTQHLPDGFFDCFRDQVARMTAMPVVIARDGLIVKPGTVYLASGEGHLRVERAARYQFAIRVHRDSSAHGAFPAVDPMFIDLANAYGSGACGVILSGMGRDGTEGARRIVAAGGWIVAQDRDSSSVWGMPGSVVREGLASVVTSPAEMVNVFSRDRQVAA